MTSTCALCSAQFDRYYDPDDPTHRLSWRQEIRAITTAQDGKPRLTSVGYIRVFSVLVSLDSEVDYTSPRFRTAVDPLHLWHRSAAAARTFLFHEFCWQLLVNEVDGERQKDHLVYFLYNVLTCVPRAAEGKLLMADHIDRQSLGLDESFLQLPETESYHHIRRRLLGDPRHKLALDGLRDDDASLSNGDYVHRQTDPGADIFRKLPIEILHIILSLLPTSAVRGLRSASPAVAAISQPNALPSTFWASRFAQEADLNFAFAHEPRTARRRKDWRREYAAYKRALRSGAGSEGIWSRKRICGAIEPYATTLKGLLSTTHGVRLGKTIEERCGQIAACPRLPQSQSIRPLGDIQYGSTKFGSARLNLKSDEVDELTIAVSTVSWSSEPYISGLRVLALEKGVARVVSEAGLILPLPEQRFVLKRDDVLLGVEVVMSLSGIRGLRFVIHRDGENLTESVGNTVIEGCSVGITRLRAINSSVEALDLDFDICKLIGVQLVDPKPTKQDHHKALTSQQKKAAHVEKFMPSLHWSPQAPPQQPCLQTYITPCLYQPKGLKTHLYMPLGGQDGSRLGQLSSITAFTDAELGFRGFRCRYGDGSEDMFGHKTRINQHGALRECKEAAFFIDGKMGERITSVEVTTWRASLEVMDPDGDLCTGASEKDECFRHTWRHEVKVTTNFDRSHIWLDSKKHLPGMEKSTHILRGSTKDSVVVAFLAAFDSPGGGGFDRFGVQTRPLGSLAPVA